MKIKPHAAGDRVQANALLVELRAGRADLSLEGAKPQDFL